jgi:hypothetical protein
MAGSEYAERRVWGTGMRSRVVGTIAAGVGWLVFVLLFAGFWAVNFTLFQNVIIFFVTLVILLGLLGIIWASWGLRWVR